MSERRTWLPFLATLLLVVVGLTVVLVFDRGSSAPRCATKVAARSPLVTPARFGDDEHLSTLASSVGRMGSPFGEVRAGVGFNYDQWLHLYGVGDGLLAFTKNNAALTVLDGKTLRARWALRPATKRIAWDASATRLALLDLSSKKRVRVGSYDLASGRERWCVELSTKHKDGQPVSTAYLENGDLLVALPVSDGLDVARMSAKKGHVRWSAQLEGVGRADFLAQLDAKRFVAGGDEAFRLAGKADPKEHSGFGVFSLADGRRLQPFADSVGERLHVVGVRDNQVITLSTQGDGTRLESESLGGIPRWTTKLPDASLDVTLRDGIVLARSRTALQAYGAEGGKLLWRSPVPTDRTFFPYGFTLDQMPSLDATHVLVPTTTSLEVLDVTTGKHVDYPMPTDGVSTTYWPYQLVSTDSLIGVVTNTGAVLADRDVGPVG